jgi:hypothetical protein
LYVRPRKWRRDYSRFCNANVAVSSCRDASIARSRYDRIGIYNNGYARFGGGDSANASGCGLGGGYRIYGRESTFIYWI